MKPLVLALCVIAALASPTPAKEKDPGKDAVPFKPVQGAFFAVSVPNMAESVQWYREKLGLSVVLEAPGGTQVTALEGGGLFVELLYDPAARPGPTPPETLHGVYKAGFFVKDFDTTVQELRARGVAIAFGPFPAHDGQRANVLIRDNAGNLIQIFGD
jgi:catechol 2,3-dioxygenase-like lactoylglutathione lyase family enzyme